MQDLTWSPQLQHVVKSKKRFVIEPNESTFKDSIFLLLSQEERDAVQSVYKDQKLSVEVNSTICRWD